MQNIIKISIFIIIIFIIGVFFMGLNKDTNYKTNFLTGKKISNISLEYFDENKFYKEEDLKRNNYTLINFWASWCLPCRQEHSLLTQLSKEKNLKLLGVNFKDKKKQAETVFK
jgi:cytochrome c biogenesis protein CcmG/thiol:disulfide interchange protein DsbE